MSTAKLFRDRFGRAPAVIASAPGRVNLIGEHTDYNGGEVLPIAIGARTVVAISPSTAGESRIVSTNMPDERGFNAMASQRSGQWWDYVAGMIAEVRALTALPEQFDIAVSSDVPVGAGLSSSAALEVAVGTALSAVAQSAVGPRDIALAAHRAENNFVGVASGIMDQFASALAQEGHALHVWCDVGEYEHVQFADAVLIFDTGVTRELRGSAYNERQAECAAALGLLRQRDPSLSALARVPDAVLRAANLPDVLSRRARHVTSETLRVRSAIFALRGSGVIPGELLTASHASLRDDFACSSPELDWFVERVMHESGVRGARLTGAGWGGCAIALGDAASLAAVAPAITQEYQSTFGREARTWITVAGDGARVELNEAW